VSEIRLNSVSVPRPYQSGEIAKSVNSGNAPPTWTPGSSPGVASDANVLNLPDVALDRDPRKSELTKIARRNVKAAKEMHSSSISPGFSPPPLFPYQREIVDKMFAALISKGPSPARSPSTTPARPLAIVPTAGGKSFIIAGLAQKIIAHNPAAKIVVTARSNGIAIHNFEASTKFSPGVARALFKGKPLDASITFATAQKLYRHLDIAASADFVIVDEADQAFFEDAKQYGSILNAARRYCGLTGTPFRLVGGETKPIFGPDTPFDTPVAFVRKKNLIDLSRIIPVEALSGSAALDLGRVRLNKATGLFDTHIQSTSRAMLGTIVADVRVALSLLPRRRGSPGPFLFYASKIEQAKAQAAAFVSAGMPVAAGEDEA
jgi:superfamily II DNA or RNA helicase